MKKIIFKTFFLLGVLSVLMSSCEKEDDSNFELRFTNISSNSYSLEVNGGSSTISGGTFVNYDLKKGTYSWKVTQLSGYLLYPTIKEGTVNLDQDKEVVFP